MLDLYCMPLGATMRNQFITAMAERAAGGRMKEAALILPSSFLLHAARSRLRRIMPAGYQQADIFAFDELVNLIVRQRQESIYFLDRMTQEMLVEEILTQLVADGCLPYFSQIASFPGYVSTITSLIGEIKRTGASPDEFAAAAQARDWPAKDRELELIYRRYQEQLAERRLADLEEMYLLAIHMLSAGQAALPYKDLYFSEFYVLTPLQQELLRQLRFNYNIAVGLAYERNRPELYAAVEDTYTSLVGMGFIPQLIPQDAARVPALEHLGRRLFTDPAERSGDGGGVTLLSCPHRRKEIEIVANQVKKMLVTGEYSPADIAVVVRDISQYDLLRPVFKETGLPLCLPQDEPLQSQPMIQFIVALLQACLDGGSRQTVIKLVKLPPVAAGFGIDADYLEWAVLPHVINSWQDWLEALAALRKHQQAHRCRTGIKLLRRLAGRLPQRATCAAFVSELQAIISQLAFGQYVSRAYSQGLLPLEFLKAGLASEQLLAQVFDTMLQGFAMVGKGQAAMEIGEFLQRFRQVTAGQTVRLRERDENGIQVVSPAGTRGITFPVVVVLGLSDGQFPGRERENWLYNDQERKLLSDLGLPMATTGGQRQQEDLYFAIAVTMATEKLILSYIEDEQTLPSPYIAEVRRLFADSALEQRKYYISELFLDQYEAIYNPAELRRKALFEEFNAVEAGRGTDIRLRRDILAQLLDDDFKRRLQDESTRSGRQFTVFDGALQAEKARQHCEKSIPAQGFSITALEDYAQCPFSYYFLRILKLRAWEEAADQAANDVIGTIYHEVLTRFMSRHRSEKLVMEHLPDYQATLMLLLEEACVQQQQQGKLHCGKGWKWEKQRMTRLLKRWLLFEIEQQAAAGLAFQPRYLEWGFGLEVAAGMDAASVTSPLAVAVGTDVVRVVGKVDRIDAAGDQYMVIDYKKGHCPNMMEIVQGRDLQVPLYIMAVEQFLCGTAGKIAGGGYYSVEKQYKDGGMWREEPAREISHRIRKKGNLPEPEWQAMQQAVKQYVKQYAAGIRTGYFPVQPSQPCSPYCPARTICRYDSYRFANKQQRSESDE